MINKIQDFQKINMTDTCAVWNILSSNCLYLASQKAKLTFWITPFILYECLTKERKNQTIQDSRLQQRLIDERSHGNFKAFSEVSIEDLQKLEIVGNRKRLSKGELTAVAVANKYTDVGFITDDMGARIMAEKVIEADRVKTTPLLLGWLFHAEQLFGSDFDTVIKEHVENTHSKKGDLTKFFGTAYQAAIQLKQMSKVTRNPLVK